MEKKHADRVRQRFASELDDKPVIVLGIPDDYRFMDPQLVELLRTELTEYLVLPESP